MNYHNVKAEQAVALLFSSNQGLSTKEAEKRLRENGNNEIKGEKKKSLLQRFLLQLYDFSIIILLIAAAVSYFVSYMSGEPDFTDTAVILAIVILNAVIGVFEESKAQKALDALKKLSAPAAVVKRNGKQQKISASEIVDGDILILSAGDVVSADARLIASTELKIDESTLTGESLPAQKDASLVLSENTSTADRKNMVFSSTLVTSGHGEAVVTDTGMNTEIGKIAKMLTHQKNEDTPLQQRLAKLSKLLGSGALAVCAVIFVLALIRRSSAPDAFMTAVSLAVAAIPEGLPAIVTIVLSLGVGKLSKKNAIVRRLPSIETLGSASVICSDKTGTLTQNKMTATRVYIPEKKELDASSPEAAGLFMYASLCCNSSFEKKGGRLTAVGEPTENAILNVFLNSGQKYSDLEKLFPRIREIPFSSETKMMTTVHRNGKNFIQVTKGAPDILLSKCKQYYNGSITQSFGNNLRSKVLDVNSEMAKNALRVIAVTMKQLDSPQSILVDDLTFLGLIGIEDPIRPEAVKAVSTCKNAGITPVMITGDHALTAKATAKKLGIYTEGFSVINGDELERMSDEQLKEAVCSCSVFARVTPEHKVKIVDAYKSNGEIVAMTGDGVNDAPALKRADIGCAMGKNGTEVAKNASDLVLADDNFATIVNAVEIGRGLFDNIKKSVRFLLSSNIGEILLVFSAFLLGYSTPLLPIQLLWINLVTDSLPAMALGMERPEKDIMSRKPLAKDKGIITKTEGFDIAVEGMLFGALSLFAFIFGTTRYSIDTGRTMAFCALSFLEIFHAFNVRSTHSIFKISPVENINLFFSTIICALLQISVVIIHPLIRIFNTVPLNLQQWLVVGFLCIPPIIVSEAEKFLQNKKQLKKQ
ncbi:MAG: Calcium-transporting ATPase 1 [Firmicutes bacterium ADurb.Bin300]|nr:MAG: Calcium-transporting ATPase 1 [Firmicutes bacterium ADurb.Bin300]